MNKVVLIGNVCSDPELRYTGTGVACLRVRVATNERWNNSAGETQNKATFHTCLVWAKQAEGLSKFLAKGHLVSLEGRINNRSWEDKEGAKRWITEIVCREFNVLSKKEESPPPEEDIPPPSDTDAPF